MDLNSKGKALLQIANLSEQVYRQIKQDILRKEIALGSMLVESELCLRYQVSRTPVREAIQMLNADGIVEKVKHHSTRIIAMSELDALHLIQVRTELEIVALMEIAPHFTDEDHAELMELHERCILALDRNDLVGLYETDGQFHLELARRSGNPFLHAAYKKINSKVQLLRSIEYSQKDRIMPVLTMHESILDCLRRGNPEGAIGHMRRHIRASNDFILFPGPGDMEHSDGQ